MSRQPSLWRQTHQAYIEYITLRMQFFASADLDEQISKALHHATGRQLALRTLNNVATTHIIKHAAAVFREAMSGTGDASLARAVLARLDPAEAKEVLTRLIREACSEAVADSFALGNVVDLLNDLEQQAMVRELLPNQAAARCGGNSDEPRAEDASVSLDFEFQAVDDHNDGEPIFEKWELELRAEQKFLSLRKKLVNDPDVGEHLREGLRSDRGLAMEILFDLPVEYTKQNITEVFDDATSTNGYFDPARDLLARLEFAEATEILRPLVEQRLATDDNTWEAYLRSAEMLGELGQDELLEHVVARARKSPDPDVLDTAEYYDSGTFRRLDRVSIRQARGQL